MARRNDPTATGSRSLDTGNTTGNTTRDDDLAVRHTSDDVSGRDRTGVLRDQVDRQHESFGGMKWGAAFFGWLSANGLTVILLAIASAAGVAIGLTKGASTSDAT